MDKISNTLRKYEHSIMDKISNTLRKYEHSIMEENLRYYIAITKINRDYLIWSNCISVPLCILGFWIMNYFTIYSNSYIFFFVTILIPLFCLMFQYILSKKALKEYHEFKNKAFVEKSKIIEDILINGKIE